MKLKIFFSWQSADTKHNKNFISDCIAGAVKKIKQTPDFKNIEFIITDALRHQVGQVAVADTIIDTVIPACDIFVADLTATRVSGLVRFFTGSKPIPNPNVMTEYGVALKSLGKERIISLINTSTNGSPRNNAEIIPFDVRQDRFPTEFNYSKKSENRKAEIKKTLIDDLASTLKPTIKHVLETQKSRFRPFVGWNELNESLKKPQASKFVESDKFKEIKVNVTSSVSTDPIRILGLSGLGKTRIIFELFRPQNDDNNSLLFSNRLLYVNCNDYQDKINFTELISKIAEEKKDAILLVDNCDLETHRIISRNRKDLSFISIDSNPEENSRIEGTNYIVINKTDLTNVVTQLVDSDFHNVGEENIKRIKDFSQGIPLMAVLLAESVTKGERFLGKLDDKELLDKLLGAKGKEHEWRSILKSCSMFSYIGYEKEAEVQYQFIATNENITISNNSPQVRLSTFLEVINHFKEREIFEPQGRFISIRPFPLAMALAVEWLDTCTSERILQVITDIANLGEPHRKQLIDSLSEQMKYLGYNDKAVEIVEKIVGPGSPFDSAEVLNTELGSRLFRSFVEVNPVAVSENFKRIFSNSTVEQLLRIQEGRRNLVWVLEKLCFDKRTFADSAKILLKFAIAENETWSNNATGQFLHLFNTHLSGTEATLQERWSIIEWLLNEGGPAYIDFAIRAMKIGLNFGHFSRMGGAEQQGNKRLVDNDPTWAEIEEYWGRIFNKLLEIVKANNRYSEPASEKIADSIRGLFRVRMGDLILPYLKEIAALKGHDWEKGLVGLKQARRFEKDVIGEKMMQELEKLINSLTKTDFSTRYLRLANSYYLDYDRSFSSEKVIEAIRDLADEFISTKVPWEETFPSFYSKQQVFSYHFGRRISEILHEDGAKARSFIQSSLEAIKTLPPADRNFTVLAGFVGNSKEEIKEEFYSGLALSDEFCCQLFYFLANDQSGSKYFDLLFGLIDNNRCVLANFNSFNYAFSLSQLNLDELNTFAEKLFAYGPEGYAIVFDLFFDVGYNDEAKKISLMSVIKKCILKLGFNRKFNRQLDDYKWSEAIRRILTDEKETEFAEFINISVIQSITWENSYHLDNYVQQVYETLMSVHFNAIWPELAKALLSKEEDYFKFYGLKHILGSNIGGVGRSTGVLFDGDVDLIFKWCENNRQLAPARLAELIPIYDGNNKLYTSWNPIALRLIDEFGDIKEVLSNMSSNMGSYSWVGSLVPYLTAKKELFKQLLGHKIVLVKEWAASQINYLEKDIERERYRDEERFL
ncbi:hypothetical protein [Pedobacter miscanthi]|uniref:hypothetical protein n=1 Tax=Pedobacter miscanthi TaxID=2259170 RepID=UPI00292D0D29|nr:hypothetical protein [Pedobacter miscanthi]